MDMLSKLYTSQDIEKRIIIEKNKAFYLSITYHLGIECFNL